MVGRRAFICGLASVAIAEAAPVRARAQSASVLTLRLASNSNDDVTPLLWAQQNGLLAKAGLAIEFEKFGAGSAVMAATAGGAVDIGKSDLLPLIGARSRGIPIQLVAPGEMWLSDNPISGMVVLKESPIVGAKDLNGKTLPTPGLHDLLETSTRAWTDTHGGDSSTLRFVEMPTSAQLDALLQGRVPACNLSAPFFGNALATGKTRLLCRPDDAIAKRFMISGWYASEAFIAKNRDALARFVRVYEQAAIYTNTHTAETVQMSAAFTGIAPDVLAGMTRAYCGSVVDPKDIAPLVDAAVKYHVIEKPPDLQQLIAPVALRAHERR